MCTPTIAVNLFIDKLDEFMLEFSEHDQMITAGVAAVGEAAAYAEVWEWGNVRQHKPGPKTLLGTNPDGDMVWLTIQAPFGYIKINENQYWEVLKIELEKVKFKGTKPKAITEELEEAASRAMRLIAKIIGDHAPVDKGDLSRSFKVIEPGDVMLDSSDDERMLVIGREE